jgi:hypothetical protein
LLAYQTAEDWRLLVNLGPHENFYRDLKRWFKVLIKIKGL